MQQTRPTTVRFQSRSQHDCVCVRALACISHQMSFKCVDINTHTHQLQKPQHDARYEENLWIMFWIGSRDSCWHALWLFILWACAQWAHSATLFGFGINQHLNTFRKSSSRMPVFRFCFQFDDVGFSCANCFGFKWLIGCWVLGVCEREERGTPKNLYVHRFQTHQTSLWERMCNT